MQSLSLVRSASRSRTADAADIRNASRLSRRRISSSGWPTNVAGTPRLLVERRLERKDHEHAIGDALDRLHAARPPGPQLRADVVDDRHADACAARARGSKLKSGKSIGDEHVAGASASRAAHQRAIEPPRARQDAHRFGQAGDRQAAEIADERGARGAQPIAAEAGDRGVRARASGSRSRARRRRDRRTARRTRSSRAGRSASTRTISSARDEEARRSGTLKRIGLDVALDAAPAGAARRRCGTPPGCRRRCGSRCSLFTAPVPAGVRSVRPHDEAVVAIDEERQRATCRRR